MQNSKDLKKDDMVYHKIQKIEGKIVDLSENLISKGMIAVEIADKRFMWAIEKIEPYVPMWLSNTIMPINTKSFNISYSLIKAFLTNPAECLAVNILKTKVPEARDYFEFGKVFEDLLCFGVITPQTDCKLLKDKDMVLISKMVDTLRGRPWWQEIINCNPLYQNQILLEDDTNKYKALLDVQTSNHPFFSNGLIVDIKTCADIKRFKKNAYDLRYDLQAAFYIWMYLQYNEIPLTEHNLYPTYYILGIDKSPEPKIQRIEVKWSIKKNLLLIEQAIAQINHFCVNPHLFQQTYNHDLIITI